MAGQQITRSISSWIQQQRQHRVRWTAISLLIGFGVISLFGTVFPWIGYQIIAPQGWHNVTLHGTINGYEYAVSHDDPGLMLACGSSMEQSFLFAISWKERCWRTHDGGENWTDIQPPPIPSHSFHLIVPRADAGTVFAVEDNIALHQQPPQSVVVTHDAGATWQYVTQLVGGIGDFENVEDTLALGIYRGEKLYSLIAPASKQEGATPQDFAFSTDDGKTWTRPERTPSTLRRTGWQITGFAADYRLPHGWYRSLTNTDSGTKLEHSIDDGQTWTTVGVIMNSSEDSARTFDSVTLATTPTQPQALCAADDGIWLAASSDGGKTWRGGASQLDLSNTNGMAPWPVQIGNNGTCYHDYNYSVGPWSPNSAAFHDVILQLGPDARLSTAVPLDRDVTLAFSAPLRMPSWWYVPGGHGRSPRIVIHANRYFTVAGWLTTWGHESLDEFLFWRPVP